jgi:hypothetical protein
MGRQGKAKLIRGTPISYRAVEEVHVGLADLRRQRGTDAASFHALLNDDHLRKKMIKNVVSSDSVVKHI